MKNNPQKSQPRGPGAGERKSRSTTLPKELIARWKGRAKKRSKYDKEYRELEDQGYTETVVETIGRVAAFRKKFRAIDGYKVLSQQDNGKYRVLVIDLSHPGGKELWEEITSQ